MKIFRRIWLFVRLIGRTNQAEYRNGVKLSWDIAKICHP